MSIVAFFAAGLQLILAIILAIIAIYIGLSVFGKLTKGIDEIEELKRGNTAIGIIFAALVISIAIVVQSGVMGVTAAIGRGALLLALGVGILQLVIGVALAVGAQYLALNVLDRVTKGIDEFEELKKGNTAVAILMAGVMIAVAVIIQSGVAGITAALIG